MRRAASLAAVVAVIGLVVSGCSSGSASAEPVPSLIDAGATDETITFPVPFAAGQTATSEGVFDLTLSIDGFGVSETFDATFDLRLTETVQEVDSDGGAVVHSTIDDVDVTEAPEDFDPSSYEGLAGVTIVDHRDASGQSQSRELLEEQQLTEDQRATAEEILSGFESATVVYPDETVGVGARWTGEQSVTSSGLEVPVTYEYELVELTAETYTIAISIDTDIDDAIEGARLTGNYTGQGTVIGDRDNPLALEVAFELTGEADIIERDGDTASMTFSIDVQLAPAVPS